MPFGIAEAVGLGLSLINGLGGRSNPQADAIRDDNERKRQLFEMALEYFKKLQSGGQYDPTRRLDFLDSRINAQRGRELSDLAGANTIMGYRPGDTAAQDNLARVDRGYRYQHQQLANDIMNEVPRMGLDDILRINGAYPSMRDVPNDPPRFGAGDAQLWGQGFDWATGQIWPKRGGKATVQPQRNPIQTKINVGYGSTGGFRSPLDNYLNYRR